ncbi:hypothetical protein VSR82_12550 [Burkholderia sp. JPY481]|uniref:hypothetical protein n=1 Tax=unclassified Paraburkholderia TaxID=2615204 RepID=UPI00316C0AEB
MTTSGRQVIVGAVLVVACATALMQMKSVGHDAVVGVLLCAALAFLVAVWWERRRITLRTAS